MAPRLLPALLVGALLCALLPAGASAITRAQANRIALDALDPQSRRGPVVVFTLRRALGPDEFVTQANPRAPARTVLGAPRGRRWFFWMDLLPGALFAHPSVAVTIDDRTGRVLQTNRFRWSPLIDGRQPPYLRTPAVYRDRRWRIFGAAASATGPARARASTLTTYIPFGGRRENGPIRVPPERFARDCLVNVGDRHPDFAGSYRAITSFAADMGIRRTVAEPSARGLREGVEQALARGRPLCDDVFIYLAGHGLARRDGPAGLVAKPTVTRRGRTILNRSEIITPEDVRAVLRAHPSTTFKVKVVSCYSGRFVPALRDEPNLRVLETSSAAGEPSWFDIKNGQPLPGGRRADDETDNPTGADEFTNGNVHGLYEWARIPDVGDGLAEGIAKSFDLGRDEDYARSQGLTHPQLVFRRRVPLGILIEGRWRFFGGSVIEVEYRGVVRSAPRHAARGAAASPVTEVVVDVPGGRTIVNHLCPRQLPNGVRSGGRLTCSGGSLPLDTPFTLNVQTSPAPAVGMGGQISARQDGRPQGPFPIAGP